MLYFSLILISKIITIHLLVTNVVNIIIQYLTMEKKRNEIRFLKILIEMSDKVFIENC